MSFSKLTFLKCRWHFWNKSYISNMCSVSTLKSEHYRKSSVVTVPKLTNLTQLLETKLTFSLVLQFKIWKHLNILVIFNLFQKCHLEFKSVNFENNDILFYLLPNLNHHLTSKYCYGNALNYFLCPVSEFSRNCCTDCMTFVYDFL